MAHAETDLGHFGVCALGGLITQIVLPGDNEPTSTGQPTASDRELAGHGAAALTQFIHGNHHIDWPPYNPRVLVTAPFYRKVLAQLSFVGPGETVTYGELARRAGNPRAVRAAAGACAANPLPIIIGCHRVLPATGGTVGGYRGGQELKRALLAREGYQEG
ncbi:hypothetical protein CAQU_00510 [Corynebacterium aquilae DSM 44791]|uniref:methylated-DNA--[protein]-cysteine S-methyltransferase n=1 Tax=Corynebacterium aquilae DSM 44791 TaxID=1431546 RepID=A0A1L7CDA4_9CORY|nr:hypothetical protein CAQU_00510 [Corynebacterium aquilae DSM 44791]